MVAAGFAVAVGVGVWFVYSGLAKYLTKTFAEDLSAYRLLPPAAVRPTAALLPLVEVLLGLGLVVGLASSWLLAAAAICLAIFSSAMVINLLRGRRVSCGCQGGSKQISWQLVVQNLLVAIGSLAVATSGSPVGLPAVITGAQGLSRSAALGVMTSLMCAAVTVKLVSVAHHFSARLAGITYPIQPDRRP